MSVPRLDRVWVPMRDGTRLRGELSRCGEAAAPTILRRTPYERWPRPAGRSVDHERLLRAGYHVLVQSVRGRHGSQGRFEPYVHEARDGVDTVEWIAEQEWSDGRVAMVGRSYDAAAQWLVAQEAPPALQVLVPQFGAADFAEGWAWYGGARQLGFLVDWLREDFAGDPLVVPDLAVDLTDPDSAQRQVRRVIEVLQQDCPWLAQWWDHPPGDELWQTRSARPDRVRAACLHVGGWYDIFLDGTLRAHATLVDLARAGHDVGEQRLVVGPWSHDDQTGRFATRDHGPDADLHRWDLTAHVLDFLGRNLPTTTRLAAREEPAPRDHVFDLGLDAWREVDSWAPGLEAEIALSGLVVTGGSTESTADATAAATDHVVATWPLVATTGGNHAMKGIHPAPAGPGTGPAEEAAAGAPLRFVAAPLTQTLTLGGPMYADVCVTSREAVADLAVQLVVRSGGTADLVGSGIRRFEPQAEDARRGVVTVNLGNTLRTLHPGDVLVLEIAGSSYPRFDPSPTCGQGPLVVHADGSAGSRLRVALART